MPLEHAIVALWIISSMLSCWAFSLIVRAWSDARARRDNRLNRVYTRGARRLALSLLLLCTSGAGLAGWSAAWIPTQAGAGLTEMTVLGGAGIGMIFFAALLIVWAAVGDRPRGRLRCPRCWYDMSVSEGRPCPECGREVSNQRQLLRTRRPRWAFVLAIALIGAGSAGLAFNERLYYGGWVGFVPNRVLLSRWQTLPDRWITGAGAGMRELSLLNRLGIEQIPTPQQRAFCQTLIDAMLEEPNARWDPRCMALLDACMRKEVWYTSMLQIEPGQIWIPDGERLERLYRACAEDQLLFLQRAHTPIDPELEERMLDAPKHDHGGTRVIARRWVLSSRDTIDRYGFSSWVTPNTEHIEFLNSICADLRERYRTQFDQYAYDDPTLGPELWVIESELGVLRERLPALLEHAERDPASSDPGRLRFSVLHTAIRQAAGAQRQLVLDTTRRWMLSNDPGLVTSSLWAMAAASPWAVPDPTDARTHEADAMIDLIVAHALPDTRPSPVPRPAGSPAYLIRDHAMNTIARLDPSGARYFPLLYNEIIDPETRERGLAHPHRALQHTAHHQMARNWLDTFEGLRGHEDPRVRAWVLARVPNRRANAHDERFDAIVEHALDDPDADIREAARMLADEREHHAVIRIDW